MSVRKIVKIDEEKCNGCGQCVTACAESAIEIIDGKAKLVSDVYCDGLGACLGECPQDAITIEEREAPGFDEEAVEHRQAALKKPGPLPCGCPGTAVRTMGAKPAAAPDAGESGTSQLGHWPVQLRLVPPGAPFLKGADLLISADCVPFAVPDFHERYLAGRAVLVGCPKLDDIEFYREKLKDIFREAAPRSVTVLRMEVPCCAGIVHAVRQARDEAAPDCPLEVHTVSISNGTADREVVLGKSA